MNSTTPDKIDTLVRLERRGIWLSLAVVLLLMTILLLDQTSNARQALLTLLPIGIVFGAVWINRSGKGVPLSELKANQQAMLHDELRQAAMQRACKAAFLALLGGLAAFVVVGVFEPISWSAQLVAAASVALGTTVFLASFLLFDRA